MASVPTAFMMRASSTDDTPCKRATFSVADELLKPFQLHDVTPKNREDRVSLSRFAVDLGSNLQSPTQSPGLSRFEDKDVIYQQPTFRSNQQRVRTPAVRHGCKKVPSPWTTSRLQNLFVLTTTRPRLYGLFCALSALHSPILAWIIRIEQVRTRSKMIKGERVKRGLKES